jgi:HSP20 family protein
MTTITPNNLPMKGLVNEFFVSALNPKVSDILGNDSIINQPAVNIVERDDSYAVHVAAPGYQKDDFKIAIDNKRLSVSAEKSKTEANENETFTRREYSYEKFERSFNLPENADKEMISAKYTDGVLEIDIKKVEDSTLKKTIQIEG